jgi:hypothetical protein
MNNQDDKSHVKHLNQEISSVAYGFVDKLFSDLAFFLQFKRFRAAAIAIGHSTRLFFDAASQ